MACAVLSPIYAMLPSDRLQLFNAPIQWVVAHGNEQLGGCVHSEIVLPVTSFVKGQSESFSDQPRNTVDSE